jgi:hypothetical protein
MRRVACTKSKLYFMLPGDELVRDSIPLEEICAVELMGGSNSHGKRPNKLRRVNNDVHVRRSSTEISTTIAELENDTPVMCLNAFQIRTAPGGFNSGRVYYLQAESREVGEGIIEILQKLIVNAKTKAKGTSRFMRSQELARSIYESPAFQIISALLIIVVRHVFFSFNTTNHAQK